MSTDAIDTPLQDALLDYCRYPGRYFWRWSDEGVAEWKNGTTIAYAAELMPMLAELAPDGLPPLGAVLLVFAACTDGWQDSSAELGLLHGLLPSLLPVQDPPPTEELLYLLRVASGFLEIIRALPAELRTGRAKLHLLRELLLEPGAEQLNQHAPQVSLTMPAGQFKQLMAEIGSNPQTLELLTLPNSPVTRQQVRADLRYFDRALSRFTVHSLELRLRTSLTALPKPLALDLPTPPADAEPTPTNLLAELAQEAPTAGLARLAQRLSALLHLPQPAEGAGSLPLGGVADITNRGSFDRLLLSELAQDDLSLTARLVHGEALYLRREEPPAPQPPPRVVLVDTTIQLWGEPRVFALAAALAVAHPARLARAQPRVAAYALGGALAQPLDLFTKAGVTEALGYLDPALHCGAALNTLLRTPTAAPTDYLLITEAEAATHPDFGRHLAEAAPALRFLLTVARSGEVAFYEFRQGRRTLLSTLQVDLEELLFAKLPATRRLPVPAPSQLVPPTFLEVDPCPLALPTVDFQPTVGNCHYQGYIYDAKFGLVGLTTTRRLLHWPGRGQGARELLHVVEDGKLCLGFDGIGTVYLLLINGARQERIQLYTISLLPLAAPAVHDLSSDLEHLPGIQNLTGTVVQDVFFGEKESFCLRTPAGYLALLCRSAPPCLVSLAFTPSTTARFMATPGQLKKFVNNGYNVLQRISRVGVNALGELTIGNHSLIKTPPNVLKLQANKLVASPSTHTAYFAEDIYALLPNKLIRFQYAAWPDGSEAITDSRGLLHLRSANAALPEITLVLVLGKSIAAWANAGPDGAVCGSPYFIQGSLARLVSVAEFYQLYIQPFIDHIVAHEAKPASA
jgi:hypothetical protein